MAEEVAVEKTASRTRRSAYLESLLSNEEPSSVNTSTHESDDGLDDLFASLKVYADNVGQARDAENAPPSLPVFSEPQAFENQTITSSRHENEPQSIRSDRRESTSPRKGGAETASRASSAALQRLRQRSKK
jgi:hypothetical protein